MLKTLMLAFPGDEISRAANSDIDVIFVSIGFFLFGCSHLLRLDFVVAVIVFEADHIVDVLQACHCYAWMRLIGFGLRLIVLGENCC